ncbi:MAG: hypothetical protein ACKPKO_49970, partial [Candidatus Fonsibacter sp.]
LCKDDCMVIISLYMFLNNQPHMFCQFAKTVVMEHQVHTYKHCGASRSAVLFLTRFSAKLDMLSVCWNYQRHAAVACAAILRRTPQQHAVEYIRAHREYCHFR